MQSELKSIEERFELKNGEVVLLKFADPIKDYDETVYKQVYFWLYEVDHFLSRKFRLEDLEMNRRIFLQWIRQKNVKLLIAKRKKDIIAQASLEFPHQEFMRNAHVGTLGIAVHPEYQNSGLGTRMLQLLEVVARRIGLYKLQLECVAQNQIALNVYEKKLGFFHEGCRKNMMKLRDGTFSDLILLGKNLKPPAEWDMK